MKLSYISFCLTMILLVPCAASEQNNNAWYKQAALYAAVPFAAGTLIYASLYYKGARFHNACKDVERSNLVDTVATNKEERKARQEAIRKKNAEKISLVPFTDKRQASLAKQQLQKIWYSPTLQSWFSLNSWQRWFSGKK